MMFMDVKVVCARMPRPKKGRRIIGKIIVPKVVECEVCWR